MCSASSVTDGVRVGRFDLNALVLLVYPRTHQTWNKRGVVYSQTLHLGDMKLLFAGSKGC